VAARTARDSYLRRRYGISEAEYEAILELQQGACFICEKVPKQGQRRLHVDHLHVLKDKKQPPKETRKRVRGLLCWSCNGAIGKFKDSITLLRAAAAYLEELPAQQILRGDIDE
jgi:hypothetical protein